MNVEKANKLGLELKPIGPIKINLATTTVKQNAFIAKTQVTWLGMTRMVPIFVTDGMNTPLLGQNMLKMFRTVEDHEKMSIRSKTSKVKERLFPATAVKSVSSKCNPYQINFNEPTETLEQHKALINKLLTKSVPMHERKLTDYKAKMVLESGITLLPRQSMKVKVKFKEVNAFGPFLFEPNTLTSAKHGTCIINGICNVSEKFAWMTNFSSKKCHLRKGTTIGYGHEYIPSLQKEVKFFIDDDGQLNRFNDGLEEKSKGKSKLKLTVEGGMNIPKKLDSAINYVSENYNDVVINDLFENAEKLNKTLDDYPNAFSISDATCRRLVRNICSKMIKPTEDDFDLKLEKASNKDMNEFLKCFNHDETMALQKKTELASILLKYRKNFTTSLRKAIEMEKSEKIQPIRINTGDAAPIATRFGRKSPKQRDAIEAQVQEMLDAGVIEPSKSPWCSPVVLVTKKGTDKLRFCVDYRRLNEVTVTEKFPIPLTADAIDTLSGSKFFSTLDFNSAYWQLPLHHRSRVKTAFSTLSGHYHFRKLPFGLKNAVGAFSSVISNILGSLKYNSCFVYLDDIVVFGKSWKEHNDRLDEVMKCVTEAGFTLNPKKCHFGVKEITYLGHRITEDGIFPGQEKVDKIKQIKAPKTKRQVRALLGLVGYFRNFVPAFATHAKPLNDLLRDNVTFAWSVECEDAMEYFKKMLTSAPCLAHFDESKPIIVATDASGTGLGAVLKQIHVMNGKEVERVVAYWARALKPAETRYSATQREGLCIVDAVVHWETYLEGRKFVVLTDHNSLRWLMSSEWKTDRRINRFQQRLMSFRDTMEIRYKKGKTHADCDGLSRLECYDDNEPNDRFEDVFIFLIEPETFDLKSCQEEDEFCQTIITKLQTFAGKFKAIKDRFIYKDEILYRKFATHGENRVVSVVPQSLQRKILEDNHWSADCGHGGRLKTLQRIRDKWWWMKLREDVNTFVAACPDCQMRNVPSNRKVRTKPLIYELLTLGIQPFAMVGFDVVVMSSNPSPEGFKYIFVLRDYCTRFIITEATKSHTRTDVMKFLHSKLLTKVGQPKAIVMDRAPEHRSRELTEFLRHRNIQRRLCTRWHPQTNGLVERTNGTLKTILSNYVTSDSCDWASWLDEATYAINTMKHEITGYSPFFLLYGFTPVDSKDLTIRTYRQYPLEEINERPEEYEQRIQEHRIRAVRKLIEDAERLMLKKTPKRFRKPFSVGNIVSEIIPFSKQLNKKERKRPFYIPIFGKYRVIQVIDDICVKIQDLRIPTKVRVARVDTLVKYDPSEEGRKIEYTKENLRKVPYEMFGEPLEMRDYSWQEVLIATGDQEIPSDVLEPSPETVESSTSETVAQEEGLADSSSQTPVVEQQSTQDDEQVQLPEVSMEATLTQNSSTLLSSGIDQNQNDGLRRTSRPTIRHDYRQLAGYKPRNVNAKTISVEGIELTTDPYLGTVCTESLTDEAIRERSKKDSTKIAKFCLKYGIEDVAIDNIRNSLDALRSGDHSERGI